MRHAMCKDELNKVQDQKQKLRQLPDSTADLLKSKLDVVLQSVTGIKSQTLDFFKKLTSQNSKELHKLQV